MEEGKKKLAPLQESPPPAAGMSRQLPSKAEEESPLEVWQRVYEGLSDADIAEVEAIALNRSGFLRDQP